MGMHKTIHTAYHLNGKGAFAHLPKIERRAIEEIIANRHKNRRQVAVLDDAIVMILQSFAEPIYEGNYVYVDSLTELQRVVRVYRENDAWYVMEIGSSVRQPLAHLVRRNTRWILIHPIQKDVLRELTD